MIAAVEHDIASIAERLGARLKRSGPNERVGPCPVCGGCDRFGVNTRKQVFNCRHCSIGGDAIALVRHVTGLGYHAARSFIGEEQRPWMTRSQGGQVVQPSGGGQPSSEPPKLSIGDSVYGLSVWDAGVDPRGTPVERYLNSRRLDLGDDIAGTVLRWHPGIGAMIALFRNVHTDAPQAISRTFLDGDARKIDRKFLGPVGGCAIKLDEDAEVTMGLFIGEGPETCLAARQIGLRPVWALGSAGAISNFPLLSGIDALSLLREHDDANARAAIACGTRWKDAGREVLDVWPNAGNDVNDAVIGAA
jgi:putative DNA primase/helicase